MQALADERTAGRLALGGAGLSGVALAGQQRLNGELGAALADPLLAALLSFALGLLLLVVAVAARPAARRALRTALGRPYWSRLGGLGGAALVATGAAAVPQIGVALLTVGLVAGQTGGGLLVDRLGLAPGERRPLTAPRLVGAALGLVAVAVSVLGRGGGRLDPLLLALVVVAGLLAAVQQALNGRLRLATGDATVATLVNFGVGTAALGVGVAAHSLLAGAAPGAWPGAGSWYLYLGGPIGAAVVAVAAVVVRRLGVLRTPTVLLLDDAGVVRSRTAGDVTRGAVLAALDQVPQEEP